MTSAPTLDGTAATGSFSGTNTGTATLTTTNTNDVILVLVGNEESSTPGKTVSSVTASGLTFTRRGGFSLTGSGGQPWNMEMWWAPSTGTLTSKVITVTLTGNADNAVIIASGWNGFVDITHPWDTNSRLPVITSSATDTVNPPTPNFSTSQPHDAVLVFAFSMNTSNPLSSAWTPLAHPSSSGGIFFATVESYYTTFSTTQTSQSPSITAQSEVGIFYVDALTGDSTAGESGSGVLAFVGVQFSGNEMSDHSGTGVLTFSGISFVAEESDFRATGSLAFGPVDFAGTGKLEETGSGVLAFSGVAFAGSEDDTSASGTLIFSGVNFSVALQDLTFYERNLFELAVIG